MNRRFILPLFSILVHSTRPISPVRATCVPPQACRSTPSIASRRTRPAPIGGRTLMVFTSSGREFSSSSVTHCGITGRSSGEQLVDLLGDPFLGRHVALEVEIEPALVGADLAAGDVALDHRRHDMQRGVHAHVPVAALPVEHGVDLGADRRPGRIGRQHVQHVAAVGLHRVDDPGLAAVPAQHAGVAGLAAAGRIEDRAVEPHAALLDRGHGGVGFLEIGVLTEEFFDHGAGFRPSPAAPQLPWPSASRAPRPAARRNRRRRRWRSGRPRPAWRPPPAGRPARRRSSRRRRSCRRPWP